MSLVVTDIRQHEIWLTKKGTSRTYKVTRQFYKETVQAAASLTSVNQYDNHLSMAGFVQSVSDSGVENFGYKTLHTGGRYNGYAGYEVSVLRRQGVTSLTFEVSGNGGASAHFLFFIFSVDGAPDFDRDWSAQSHKKLLGFDVKKNELQEVHDIFGGEEFVTTQAVVWSDKKNAALRFVTAESDFKFDPAKNYSLSAKGVILAEAKKRSPK